MSLKSELIVWLESNSSSLNINDKNGRQALMIRAGLDSKLQQDITLEGKTSIFCPLFVDKLGQYGRLHDGRYPLDTILEAAKDLVGIDGQRTCEELLTKLREFRRKPGVVILSTGNMAIPGYKHEISISYVCEEDDQSLPHIQQEWITAFIREFKIQVTRKLGCRLDIEHQAIAHTKEIGRNVTEILNNTGILIILISQEYLASSWCQGEQNTFLNSVKKRGNDRSCVFIIEQNPVEPEEYPSEFGGIRSYRFWTAGRTGESPYTLNSGDLQYYDQLTELGHSLVNKLREMRAKSTSSDAGVSAVSETHATVFLAEATDDLYFVREGVKHYLTQAKIRVLPETEYSLEVNKFKNAVRDDLAKSDLFVQLLSDIPGRKPVDLPQGYIRCQHDLALEAHKPILQWRAPELNVDEIQDAKHRDFLQFHTVRGDIGIEGLKAEIVKGVKNLKEQASAPDETDSPRGKWVFINADVSDLPLCDRILRVLDEEEQIGYIQIEDLVHQIEDLAHQKSSVRKASEKCIKDCAALMVMYGQVDIDWLTQVFSNVCRIGWTRKYPLSVYVVCDPSPEQKQLVRMKFPWLRTLEYGSCSDEQKLHEFINSL